MTIEDVMKSNRTFLSAQDIAPILRCDPQAIRVQAREKPESMGYPVLVIGRRVRIPRIPFLRYLGLHN